MGKDKEKFIKKAMDHLRRGNLDKAIKEYESALETDPKDVRLIQKVGELYAKKNDKTKSFEYYTKAAKFLTKDGFYSRAVAIYKQMLKLDESDLTCLENIAELHIKLGANAEAMAAFQRIAEQYEKDGKITEAVTIRRRMLELDPKNLKIAIKLAELYFKSGQKDEAQKAARHVLTQLEEEGRYEDHLKFLERVVKLDPDNIENLKELAEIYADHEQWDRAYAVFNRLNQNLPDEPEVIEKLANAALHAGQAEEAVKAYKKLAVLYKARGFRQRMKEALNKVLHIRPDDPDALAVVGKSEPILQSAKTAPPKPPEMEIEIAEEYHPPAEQIEEAVEVLEEAETEEEILIEDGQLVKEPAPAAKTPRQPAPAKAVEEETPISPEKIPEFLTEAVVYLKYGLKDKAAASLLTIIKTYPRHLPALLKLKEIYKEMGKKENVLAQLKIITTVALEEGDRDLARISAQEWLQMEPQSQEAKELLEKAKAPAAATAEPPSAREVELEIEVEDAEEIEEVAVVEAAEEEVEELTEIVEEEVEEAEVEEMEAEAEPVEAEEVELETPPEKAAPAAEAEETSLAEEAGEEEVLVEEAPEDFAVEAEEEEVTAEEVSVEEAAEEEVLVEEAAEDEEVVVEEVEEAEEARRPATPAPKPGKDIPAAQPPSSPRPAAEVTPPPRQPTPPAPALDFSEELEEAEFYLQQGIYDEARKIYLAILERDPHHELSRQKLSQLETAAATTPAAAEEPVEEVVIAADEPHVPFDREPPPPELIIPEPHPAPAPPPVEHPPAIEPPLPMAPPPPPPPPAAKPSRPAPAAPKLEPPPPPPEPAYSLHDLGPEEARPAAEEEHFDLKAEIAEEMAAGDSFFTPPASPAGLDLFGPAQPGEDLFDLAAVLNADEELAELGASPGAEDLTAAEIRKFKQSVAQQFSEHDSAVHYDLGIAYKEMALLDDAVHEFLIAARDSSRYVDSMLMCSLIFREKGELDKSLEACTNVLEATATEKQRAAAFFELAEIFSASGQKGESKWALEQVKALDPSFPQIDQRLAALMEVVAVSAPLAPQAPPPAPPPPPAPTASLLPPELPPPVDPTANLPPAPEPPRQPPAVPSGPLPSREPKSWEEAALEPPADSVSPTEAGEEDKKKKRKKISYI